MRHARRAGLALLTLLIASPANAQGTTAGGQATSWCVVAEDSGPTRLIIPGSGETDNLDSNNALQLRGLAWHWNDAVMYAVHDGGSVNILGTHPLSQAGFQPCDEGDLQTTVGSLTGADGGRNLQAIVDITYDRHRDQLLALDATDPQNPIVVVLDPDTCRYVPDAFGVGDDYLLVGGLTGVPRGIAHDASSDTLYTLGSGATAFASPPALQSLDRETGATTYVAEISGLGDTYPASLSIAEDGSFWVSGDGFRLAQVDPTTGVASDVIGAGEIVFGAVECAHTTGPGTNGCFNGTLDGDEAALDCGGSCALPCCTKDVEHLIPSASWITQPGLTTYPYDAPGDISDLELTISGNPDANQPGAAGNGHVRLQPEPHDSATFTVAFARAVTGVHLDVADLDGANFVWERLSAFRVDGLPALISVQGSDCFNLTNGAVSANFAVDDCAVRITFPGVAHVVAFTLGDAGFTPGNGVEILVSYTTVLGCCEGEDDCTPESPVCDLALNTCATCADDGGPGTIDAGCTIASPVCDSATSQCVGCSDDNDCLGGLCDEAADTCITCIDDAPGGDVDSGCAPQTPICDEANETCAACLPALADGTIAPGCSGDLPACPNGECVECISSTDCGDDVCGPDNSCVECAKSEDCTLGVCDPASSTCRTCLDDAAPGSPDGGCPDAMPACVEDLAGEVSCVPCADDADCAAGTCDETTHACVLCLPEPAANGVHAGCTAVTPICHEGACFACTPAALEVDPGCVASAPLCVTQGDSPACVQCVSNQDCDGGDCDASGQCTGCTDSSPDGDPDQGCPAAAPYCDTERDPAACVGCVTDNDCDGKPCHQASGACVACVADTDCPQGVCDQTTSSCVACLDDSPPQSVDAGCSAVVPLCIGAACVVCSDDTASGVDTGCAPERPRCLALGNGETVCGACTSGADCHHPDAPHCGGGASGWTCVGCLTDDQCDGSPCLPQTWRCGACDDDGDCLPGASCVAGRCQQDLSAIDDELTVVEGTTRGFDPTTNDLGDVAPWTLTFPDGLPEGFTHAGGGAMAYSAPAAVTGQTSLSYVVCNTAGSGCDSALIVVSVGADADGDLVLDPFDDDDDDDGIPDSAEAGDFDGDLVPDRLDLDSDGDGIPDLVEAGGAIWDADGDGRIDALLFGVPSDSNGDGLADVVGQHPLVDVDSDGDGWPDRRDVDADGDGIPDRVEAYAIGASVEPSGSDVNGNGLDDAFDVAAGGQAIRPVDSDGIAPPDFRDLDSDNDTIPDLVEGHDADLDGLPDVAPSGVDVDGRGLDDAFDPIHGGTAATLPDLDADQIPNWRDADDDADLILTALEPTDSDGDLVPDYLVAAALAGRDFDGDGVDDDEDLDIDNDGLPNSWEGAGDLDQDGLPNQADLDSDGDGLPDILESSHFGLDQDGDGRFDVFIDGNDDGLHDLILSGPFPPNPPPESDSDGSPDALDADSDGDGLSDRLEAWPSGAVPTPTGIDSDGDGLDDAFDVDAEGHALTPVDTDLDGVWDYRDADSDDDLVPDAVEGGQPPPNHDADALPDWRDPDDDGDGLRTRIEDADGDGDPTNDDTDGDGVPDYLDPLIGSRDSDGDGVPDPSDSDDDGDGVPDAVEGNGTSDHDGDGLADSHDPDSDNDGISDLLEAQAGGLVARSPLGVDTDGDGLDAAFDPDEGGLALAPVDTDGDGTPDHLDADSDADGTPDLAEGSDDLDADGLGNWRDPDDDGDGLSSLNEGAFGSDRWDPDTDNDGLVDGSDLDPLDADMDDDGIADGLELTTDPTLADSDGDGLSDGVEVGVTQRVLGGASDVMGISYSGSQGAGFLVDKDPDTTTDPADDDSDDDGLLDGTEDANGDGLTDNVIGGTGTTGSGETDPNKADTDGDGVQDGTELGLRIPEGDDTDPERFVPDGDDETSDPLDTDSDDGGQADGDEDANRNGVVDPGETNRNLTSDDDTDRDGLPDAEELQAGTNPLNPDTDGDGLLDGRETTTSPLDADSDDDGLDDGAEAGLGTDPGRADSDSDGLPDGLEVGVVTPVEAGVDGAGFAFAGTDVAAFRPDSQPLTTTDPTALDSDGDGLADGAEDADHDGAWDGALGGTGTPGGGETDPALADTDGDGIDDGDELNLTGTSPVDMDSDDGGLADGAEIEAGSDPLEPSDDGFISAPSSADEGGCGGGGGGARWPLAFVLVALLAMCRTGGRAAVAALAIGGCSGDADPGRLDPLDVSIGSRTPTGCRTPTTLTSASRWTGPPRPTGSGWSSS